METIDVSELNYPINLVRLDGGGFFVSIPDLPGCMSQGENIEEALEMIAGAKAAWIEVAIRRGKEIPRPSPQKSVVPIVGRPYLSVLAPMSDRVTKKFRKAWDKLMLEQEGDPRRFVTINPDIPEEADDDQ